MWEGLGWGEEESITLPCHKKLNLMSHFILHITKSIYGMYELSLSPIIGISLFKTFIFKKIIIFVVVDVGIVYFKVI
jgi:hypothetical protein